MTKISNVFRALAGGILCFAMSGHASAAINGSVWINDFSDNADIVPGGTPDLTFTTSLIDYDSSVTGYTIGQFLNSPVFTTGGGLAGNALNNVHIQFTGSTFLNAGTNSFVLPHDDGVRIVITGIGNVFDQPGPTSPVSTPFSVIAPSAGLYNFILDYNECCGSPARLAFEVNGRPVTGGGTVPEPATWALMFGGFVVAGAALRRRRQHAIAVSLA